jgi:aspartate kinase
VALVVQKFGGSSVATADRIKEAARRAIRARNAGHQVIVVVSARGDTTDELIELAREISENPPEREMDMLLSTGEQISIALLAMAIQELGQPAISFTGTQVGIVTDNTFTKARIQTIKTDRMRQALDAGNIVIVAGFQGIDADGNITTLGRGGSDTTAVALAAVMKHASDTGRKLDVDCEIYTDVDGVYTTDPRIVPEARKLDFLSYDEMLELASMGAGVMHSRSIEFAKKFNVPLQVRTSFSDAAGTWIIPEAEWMPDVVVCGAALVRDEARIALDSVPDQPGVSHRIFSAMARARIVVDMIAQSVGSGGKASIGFTVLGKELSRALELLQPLAEEMGATVEHEEQVSKVSIVGTGMRKHPGVAQRLFEALAGENLNLKMITTGDIKISVLVDRSDAVRALRAVHQAFHLSEPRPGAGRPTSSGGGNGSPVLAGNGGAGGSELAALTQQLLGSMEAIVVRDVEHKTDQGRITLFGLPDEPVNCLRIFQAVAAGGIVVDMIVQNRTGGRSELSFSVPLQDVDRALQLTQREASAIDSTTRVLGDGNIARLIVTGVGMRTHTGVAELMFGALASRNINISMINTSEVRITVVVDRSRGNEAEACLKEAFGIGEKS